MQTIIATNWLGVLSPNIPSNVVIRCLACNQIVMSGFGDVNTNDVDHVCPDTASTLRELECTWESPSP